MLNAICVLIFQAYGHSALSYYGAAIAGGEELPKQYTDIKDDPEQVRNSILCVGKVA